MKSYLYTSGMLREKAEIKKPSKNIPEYFSDWEDYENHIASLKSYPVSGFTSEMEGRDLVEGKDFEFKTRHIANLYTDHWERYAVAISKEAGEEQSDAVEGKVAELKEMIRPFVVLAYEVFKDTSLKKEGTLYAFNNAEITYKNLRDILCALED